MERVELTQFELPDEIVITIMTARSTYLMAIFDANRGHIAFVKEDGSCRKKCCLKGSALNREGLGLVEHVLVRGMRIMVTDGVEVTGNGPSTSPAERITIEADQSGADRLRELANQT